MRICLIAEGCYPYVAGGVSSWIQMLIEGMPEHEFVIFAIGAEEKLKGQYKYEMPKNVVEVREVFLDQTSPSKWLDSHRLKITKDVKEALRNILIGSNVDWESIFNLYNENSFGVEAFLKSREFMEIIDEVSQDTYDETPFSDTFWTIRSMLIPILELLKNKAPEADIYHTVSTGYAGIMGAKFKLETSKKLIVTEHGIYSREREEEILKCDWVHNSLKGIWINFFKQLADASYEFADKIVSLFDSARHIQIELGASTDKCMVIPNGVDTDRFSVVKPLDVNKKEFVIGAILRVVPIKDVKTLIYSYAIFKQKFKNSKLLIIGPYDEDEEYYEECLNIVKEIKSSDIEFMGRQNIDKLMNDLDVVILTSISEGQPFVVLEAMAANRPVIATDVGSCREVVEGNDEFNHCGLITPVMNPDMIARAMYKLASDRTLMIDMAQEGLKRARKYYKRTDFLKRYDELYREVAK